MKGTKYNNPHGLVDQANHSTAYEQALLSSYAMKTFATVRKIVNCKEYSCDTYFSMRKCMNRYPNLDTPPFSEGKELPFDVELGVKFVTYPMTWYNSNRLLTVPGFSGVKTGIT